MRIRLVVLLALLPAATAGCGGALSQMAVPAELAAAPGWEVEGLRGWNAGSTLRFGSFRVERVRRGKEFRETAGRTLEEVVWERLGAGRVDGRPRERRPTRAEERLRFRLRDGEGEPWLADCSQAASLRRSRLPVVGEVMHGQEGSLLCRFAPPGNDTTLWELELGTRRDRTSGELRHGDTRFAVEASDRLDNTRRRGPTSGYVLLAGGRPVAMVDVLNHGRVRVEPSLDAATRGAVAAAAAALLLRDDLVDELEWQ